MSQSLTAFADGSILWSTLSGIRGRPSSIGQMLVLMTASMRWEVRSSGAGGERFVADADGLPSCSSEIGARGALCVETSRRSRSRIWRILSPRAIERVADLPASLDLIRAHGISTVSAAERFGGQLAVVDVATRRAVRLTLPEAQAAARDGRWTSDVVATGSYVVVLSNSRAGTAMRRYRIQ